MGSVRQLHIKRAAKNLLERYPERFSSNFEENKKVLDELLGEVGKSLKNRIAGYICTLISQKKED
ncbi:MAG: 30S ribosomal protein S17e [Candidatus Hadarchaeales archaeon]